jgi:uncharacterized protein involved in exopolysaccharide biosynthesis
MIRLYPASWRARYGEELEALLSDTGADARIVGDLARGGMRMQLKAWPFPLLAVALGLAGALIGAGVSLLIPNTYRSQATLLLENAESRNAAMQEILQLQATAMSRANLAAIVNELGLYREELRVKALDAVIDDMRRAIFIDFAGKPGNTKRLAFSIRFEYRGRAEAQQTVAALVKALQIEPSNLPASGAKSVTPVEVLDQPSTPIHPVRPNRYLMSGTGCICGVFLAGMISLLRRRWKPERLIPADSISA